MRARMVPILMAAALACPAFGESIYVNVGATGGGDGSSWGNAMPALAGATAKATAGDVVWVAAGTYAGPVSLPSGVNVYGGFVGGETDVSQANPESNITVIPGGGTGRAVVSEGSDASTLLFGFTVTDGFVDIPEYGGGMELTNSHARFVRCVFSRNRAKTVGGAVVSRGGAPVFVNCRFENNEAAAGAGAFFNRDDGAPRFVNCLFQGNRGMDAGAIFNLYGRPRFANCTFAGNAATKGRGGAVFDTLVLQRHMASRPRSNYCKYRSYAVATVADQRDRVGRKAGRRKPRFQ